MLYKAVVAALVASASAFSGPLSTVASRTAAPTMQMTDFSWRSTYNGKMPGEGVVTPTAAAPSGSMSVPQACTFMAMAPSVSFEEKKAFLLSKGVSEFVITEAACTAPDLALVL